MKGSVRFPKIPELNLLILPPAPRQYGRSPHIERLTENFGAVDIAGAGVTSEVPVDDGVIPAGGEKLVRVIRVKLDVIDSV